MEVTEVRIKLMNDPHERLMAFCSITLDDGFVIRDLKLIQGKTGLFVAMPSRKLTDRCPQCHCKNHLRASFCNQCGSHLNGDRAVKDEEGRARLYADIAHPIHAQMRELIQTAVVDAYQQELVISQQPGYICSYDDLGEEDFAELEEADVTNEPVRMKGRNFRFDGPETFDDPAPQRQPRSCVEHRYADDDFGEGLL